MRNLRAALVAIAIPSTLLVNSLSVSVAVANEEPIKRDPFSLARDADEPVEVEDARTTTDTVYANPDGTYTREINALPIRVKGAEGWEPVDLTLETVEGVVRPKAALGDISLSGGGSEDMFGYSVGSARVTLSWPDELPAPELEGNVATYSNVLEGVDLKVTVTETGPTTVLVVKNEQAASNPELSRLELGFVVEGGSSQQEPGGALEILDDSGRPVAFSGEPLMWDSTGQVRNAANTPVGDSTAEAVEQRTEGPAEGDAVTTVDSTLAGDELVLEAPADALEDEDVTYPLYIDPEVTRNRHSWAMVFKQYPSTKFWHWSESSQGVGHQSGYGMGTSTKRLFWNFGMPSSLDGAYVYSAQFSANMVHSASCTKTVTKLYRTSDMNLDNRPTWNDQPSWSKFQDEKKAAYGFSGCTPGGKEIEWDAKEAAEYAASKGRNWMTFGLRAEDESDPRSWKRFAKNAKFTVRYTQKPRKPTALTTNPAVTCTGVEAKRHMGYQRPRLKAKLSDPDSGDKVLASFQFFRGTSLTESARITTVSTAYRAPGDTYYESTLMPLDPVKIVGGIKQKQVYTWRVIAKDNSKDGSSDGVTGPWSAPCTIIVDPQRPLTPQILGVDDTTVWSYPNTQKSVTFAPAEGDLNPDISLYRWRFNNDQPPTTGGAVPGAGHRLTTTVTAPKIGINTLYVWAYDAANNVSEPAEYRFETVNSFTTRTYLMDEGSPTATVPSIFDDNGGLNPLPVGHLQWMYRGVKEDEFGNGTPDPSLKFQGGESTTTTGAVIDTSRSFAVSAWLNPFQQGSATGVSHSNGTKTGFKLGVSSGSCPAPEDGEVPDTCFSFSVWDAAKNAYVTAFVPREIDMTVQNLDPWVNVVGRFDAMNGTVSISLPDGLSEMNYTADVEISDQPAQSSGQLAIGGALATAGVTSRWTGGIDHLTLIQGYLTPIDSNVIYNNSVRSDCNESCS